MNKPNSKQFTHWILTAVFLVLVAGFYLLKEPNALAQSETPPTPTESESAPVVSPTPTPPPTMWFTNPVSAFRQTFINN